MEVCQYNKTKNEARLEKIKSETVILFDGISIAKEFNKNYSELGESMLRKLEYPLVLKRIFLNKMTQCFLKQQQNIRYWKQ